LDKTLLIFRKTKMSKILALLVCTLVVCTIAQNVLPGAALLNLGMDFRQGGLVPAEGLKKLISK
jgi:preprotein translocase subunit SecF